MGSGARITYNDVRRFGFMDLVPRAELATSRHFAGMGIEPLGNELSGETLAQLFAGKFAPLKAALLDQRLVAGLGNIYVCEALFRAGLHPEAEALIRERMQDVAREQGVPYEPDRSDNVHRLNMGMFPVGARIIPNPYNRIPGFSLNGRVHFLPGFPVMAWPMMAWVLDQWHADLHGQSRLTEQAVIVHGQMEATLTPLMEDIEARFAPVKVFSLPSVDHPVHGRHIELGVKGRPGAVAAAFDALLEGLNLLGASLGPTSVR